MTPSLATQGAAALPIVEVLQALAETLASGRNAVLVAAPGAGKTTVVPLALLEASWILGRRLIVLEPRRLAARAAARRMAQTLGEEVGRTVGFRVRGETRVSAATRIEVVTEGVFTRMILDDPALDRVAGVVFDEFHERSLDADLGLAFALQAQEILRPDLRILVMSATLDAAAVARLLGEEVAVVESAGRVHPIETRYLGRDPAVRFEDDVARAVRTALAAHDGGVLVFLPGRAEIARVASRLEAASLDRSVAVAPLYGGLDLAAQDLAIAPAAPGRRKVVLATAIAETSLTLDGVGVVIDGGLSRVPRYDAGRGLTRLVTTRVSAAAAEQRRGRAGRTGPGVCLRLWDAAQTRSLAPFERPEILESDLAGLALSLAVWGAREPGELAFLDPPPTAAFGEARRLLTTLGALDRAGDLTPHGRRLATLGLPPRLAHLVHTAASRGDAVRGGRLAAVLTEPGLGGDAVDLDDRLDRFGRDDGPRASNARRLAGQWAQTASAGASPPEGYRSGALALACAYPDRVACARGSPGEFKLANGRGAWMPATEPLARSPWLAVAELSGAGPRDRILGALALDEAELLVAFADRIETATRVEVDDAGRARATRRRTLGALVLEERADAPDPEAVLPVLFARLRQAGLERLAWGEGARRLRARVAHLRASQGDAWPDLSDAALLGDLETWLAPAAFGSVQLEAIAPDALEAAMSSRLPWELRRRLDDEAPVRFVTPAGGAHAIDYAAEGGPRVDVRVQEMFGLTTHPTVGPARTPLTLGLLSPARRLVQVTRDLPGFWASSWRDVRTDMRGRYPRHPWPEDPTQAPPTVRAKPRGS